MKKTKKVLTEDIDEYIDWLIMEELVDDLKEIQEDIYDGQDYNIFLNDE